MITNILFLDEVIVGESKIMYLIIPLGLILIILGSILAYKKKFKTFVDCLVYSI